MCAGSLLSRDRARERARARLRGRRGPTQVRGLARFGGGAVRLGCLRVLPDGQPLPPRPRDAAREPIGWDEAVERLLCAVFQPSPVPLWTCLSSALSVNSRRDGVVPPRGLPIRRPESSAGAAVQPPGRLVVVELSRHGRYRGGRNVPGRRLAPGPLRPGAQSRQRLATARSSPPDSASRWTSRFWASAWARKSFCVTGSGARFYRRCHESRSSHCRRHSSGSSGGTDPAPIATAYREHGYTLREIAEYLGCHYSTVSRKLREQEGRVRECKT